ncbi:MULTISPECIES: M15 family metallopeptidase [Actinomycetes]|uniref:M15 family metallopeptidase n=2 Tax=Actinomycetes TaxID=1760 RepID=A0A5N8X7M8_9ACTN|nr:MULTISPECIES: M15 family metallopeptidase [Actinomycetes]MPY55470.1 M15 family metallopeptidase [Streptomyces acidicola]GHF30862.1 hypothetical protein GCM10017786_75960 [Amycolatopsis deserti]
MPKSQNGYAANDISLTKIYAVPGTTRNIRLRKGPAGELLVWVLAQFHARVEDLDDGQLDDWGYAERTIRGSSTTLSNHASGTAADANATRHPLGTDPTANFNAAQIRTIREIVAATRGAVRWGGDYQGRKDPMHFEIVEDEAFCARVLADLTTGTEEDDLTPDQSAKLDHIYNQLAGSFKAHDFPGWEIDMGNGQKVRLTPVDMLRALYRGVFGFDQSRIIGPDGKRDQNKTNLRDLVFDGAKWEFEDRARLDRVESALGNLAAAVDRIAAKIGTAG